MNSQTHPGLRTIGITAYPRTGEPASRARRRGVTRLTVGIVAAVVLEAIVVLSFVVLTAGIGGEPRAVATQPGAAPYVTPAPVAAPMPRPGF